MTNLILLIGAGLFSKAIGDFQEYKYNKLYVWFLVWTPSCIVDADGRVALLPRLGTDVDDAGGTGPGSYDVRGNVWHLDCCSPEGRFSDQGWLVFSAIFGWSNNGTLGQFDSTCSPLPVSLNGFSTLGTILGYVFYWIAVMVTLFVLKRRGTYAIHCCVLGY